MDTVLVSGAAGFIGSHVAEALLRRGDSVIGVDNLNDFYPVRHKEDNLKVLSGFSRFQFYRADIVDPTLLESIFSAHEISHVAHLAARAGVRPSIAQPLLYQDVNVRGSLVLLDLARRFSVQNFVLTSSSSVYGNSRSVPFREDDSATDRPISPYAATKKAVEVLAYTYHHLYQLNVNVVRPFTVYGPRGRPDMAPWLFIEAAVHGKQIRKFGDGSSRRDYTFIDDFVVGFINAIDRPFGYEVFNLGNSQTVSLNETLAIVAEVTGKELKIEPCPTQPGDVEITNADIEKARNKLSYNPHTSFSDGMKAFYEWYCAR